MNRFRTVDLSGTCNHPAAPPSGRKGARPVWSSQARELWADMPSGTRRLHGIPFRLAATRGPKTASAKRFLALGRGSPRVHVPLRGTATHVCILHFCDIARESRARSAHTRAGEVGEVLAEYVLEYGDGSSARQPIRKRFEINSFGGFRRWSNFASVHYSAFRALGPGDSVPFGQQQTGVGRDFGSPFVADIYALTNEKPEVPLKGITLEWKGKLSVGILAMTLYRGPGHPLRLERRATFRVNLPAAERVAREELQASVDMGSVTGVLADQGARGRHWLEDSSAGLGTRSREVPTSSFLVEAAATRGATLRIRAGRAREHAFSMERVYARSTARSDDGRARIEMLHPNRCWLTMRIIDESTGRPTPVRAHFSGPHGEYLPPHGHHAEVNTNWFEDYAGEVKLGAMSFAYVPGEFRIELPYGEVYAEITKGFEYAPVRRKMKVSPGTRLLEIRIPRMVDLRAEGWVTADTHVHFISPQTAWLEGQAEGLNLVNLLASQWGKLFTNVADITGEASGCSREDTIVWVGTENRHHMLGHLSMLGAKGLPVFPMCAGGPSEAYIGDPELTLLTEWAQRVREQGGAAIRPHFPGPIAEDPSYVINGLLDAAEIRSCGTPEAGPESSPSLLEWYRYLNCGYRVAVAGGTDKMSAATPVGGSRTYARLLGGEDFSFESWARAVRAGRTVVTSGPILTLAVEGHELGDEISLPESGGELSVRAAATSVWPIHRLELIVNGKVVEEARSSSGESSLHVSRAFPFRESSWVAARCTSRLERHQLMMGSGHLGAHTSPIYVTVGDRQMFSPSDALYMLTLLEGTITYLDVLGTRLSTERHDRMVSTVREAQHRLLHSLRAPH